MLIDYCDKELKYGDLVVVSFSNELEFGVVKKQGSANNLNYYSLRRNDNILYTCYINTIYKSRLLKITEDQLPEKYRKIYEKIKPLL